MTQLFLVALALVAQVLELQICDHERNELGLYSNRVQMKLAMLIRMVWKLRLVSRHLSVVLWSVLKRLNKDIYDRNNLPFVKPMAGEEPFCRETTNGMGYCWRCRVGLPKEDPFFSSLAPTYCDDRIGCQLSRLFAVGEECGAYFQLDGSSPAFPPLIREYLEERTLVYANLSTDLRQNSDRSAFDKELSYLRHLVTHEGYMFKVAGYDGINCDVIIEDIPPLFFRHRQGLLFVHSLLQVFEDLNRVIRNSSY